ncbi:unnamed protein product, partial [Hymenolepis diminuta]
MGSNSKRCTGKTCCQFSTGVCFFLSCGVIISGSILVATYSESVQCYTDSSAFCDDSEEEQTYFVVG